MATAAAITDKATRATQLRDQARMLNQELIELRKKLAAAAGNLAVLEDKRRELAEAAADGKPQKSGSAEIHAKIAEAQLPVEILQRRVSEKETAVTTANDALATLQYELNMKAEQEKKRIRFDALAKDGREIAGQVAEMLRVLVEEKLPALATVRDGLTEFINAGGQLNAGPADAEGQAARALIHEIERSFFDGPYLKVEREMLRAGFIDAGETGLSFLIKTLRKPRK